MLWLEVHINQKWFLQSWKESLFHAFNVTAPPLAQKYLPWLSKLLSQNSLRRVLWEMSLQCLLVATVWGFFNLVWLSLAEKEKQRTQLSLQWNTSKNTFFNMTWDPRQIVSVNFLKNGTSCVKRPALGTLEGEGTSFIYRSHINWKILCILKTQFPQKIPIVTFFFNVKRNFCFFNIY